jgi:predicted PurR-regulated permease PerM
MNEPTQQPTPAGGTPWDRPYTFDRVVRMVITVACVAGGIWLLRYLSGVLLPFLVAWLAAYILEPIVQYNQRLMHTRGRAVPVFATLLEVLLLLSALAAFLLPPVIREAHEVGTMVMDYANSTDPIEFIPEEVHQYLRDHIDFQAISAGLSGQDIQSIVGWLLSLISGSFNLVMSVVSWFVVLLYLVFIMIDYERFQQGARRMVPPRYRRVVYRVGHDVKSSMNRYFRGQTLVAMTVGVLFCIGFSIISLPLAVVMGLFIGLLNMVPYLQLISLVPCTLLCLVSSANGNAQFWPLFLEAMAVYVVVQCIQDLILTPRIMGRAMGLNPALILLSLSIWGSLLGFSGLIIALPLTTLIMSYYNSYVINRQPPQAKEEGDDQPT